MHCDNSLKPYTHFCGKYINYLIFIYLRKIIIRFNLKGRRDGNKEWKLLFNLLAFYKDFAYYLSISNLSRFGELVYFTHCNHPLN